MCLQFYVPVITVVLSELGLGDKAALGPATIALTFAMFAAVAGALS